jgi:uncharacterized protein YceH (UPF0502 family)
MILSSEAVRVLGALMEKEMTTPENYPLSLNGLISAANQKTSRDPVMELAENEVRSALEMLEAHELISISRDARVAKYEHRIRTVLNLRRDETAVLCLLMLRGPQTAGELRGRADRMFAFDDIAQVRGTLDRLAARETPLVRALPRSPGSREARSMHLLCGDAPAQAESETGMRVEGSSAGEGGTEFASLRRAMGALEERVAALEARLQDG